MNKELLLDAIACLDRILGEEASNLYPEERTAMNATRKTLQNLLLSLYPMSVSDPRRTDVAG